MRASLITSSALLASSSLAELLTATPVVADPTITPAPNVLIELLKKQNNDRFMGWLSISGAWTSGTCDIGGTYFQSSSYWGCCATSLAGCNVPVGCVAGSLIYSITTSSSSTRATYACTEVYTSAADASFTICNTGFLYENTADTEPLTNIFCGVRSVNWSYYRQRPSETTTTESSSSSSSTQASTPASATASSTSETATPTSQPKKSDSKAWIAGAVVGPIVGLALIGALLWFLLGRKKKNTTTQPQPPMQQQGPPAPYPAPSYPGSTNPPPAAYYNPVNGQKQPNPNLVPFGVASHNSWAPQSPTTQGSQSPQPPQGPYGAPPPAQQWGHMQQNQVYNQPPGPTSSPPPQSPAPQNLQPVYKVDQNKQLGVGERPFSAELDTNRQFPPQQQQQPYR